MKTKSQADHNQDLMAAIFEMSDRMKDGTLGKTTCVLDIFMRHMGDNIKSVKLSGSVTKKAKWPALLSKKIARPNN